MRGRYEAFTSLIININRHITKIKNDEMQELGLKGNHVQCLRYLYNAENGLTSKELEKLCEEDKASISRAFKYLESADLVHLENSDTQKYRNRYKLTNKGIVCGKTIAEKINDIMEMASKGIDDKSRESLYASLNTICDNLKNILENKGENND